MKIFQINFKLFQKLYYSYDFLLINFFKNILELTKMISQNILKKINKYVKVLIYPLKKNKWHKL
jgi:hypothetical protein